MAPAIGIVQTVQCYGATATVTCSIATPAPGDKLDALCAGNPQASPAPAGLSLVQFNVNPSKNGTERRPVVPAHVCLSEHIRV
jgi:hypothetical protein